MAHHRVRCSWVTDDPLYVHYHDHEWGVPVYDELRLFEFLILEGQQAGLNWLTILKKRVQLRQAYANFDPARVAAFSKRDFNRLLADPGVIRHRLKIKAAIQNAKAFLQLVNSDGGFSDFIWQFVDGKPLRNHWPTAKAVPVMTDASRAMSLMLKKRGFSFVGPTICYAFMQAVGMVNDHTQDCYCYQERK